MFPLTILGMFIIYSIYHLFPTFSHLPPTHAITSYSLQVYFPSSYLFALCCDPLRLTRTFCYHSFEILYIENWRAYLWVCNSRKCTIIHQYSPLHQIWVGSSLIYDQLLTSPFLYRPSKGNKGCYAVRFTKNML